LKAENEVSNIKVKLEQCKTLNDKESLQELEILLNNKTKEISNFENDIKKNILEQSQLEKSILEEKGRINNKKKEIENPIVQKKGIKRLEYFINQLNQSKNTKKRIIKVVEEAKLIESNERNLYCTSCQKNFHRDCFCNFILFLQLNNSWWCRQIGKDDYCKVCGCYYSNHKREKKVFIYESKTIVVDEDKTQKEIDEINKKIKDLEIVLSNSNIKIQENERKKKK